MIFLVRAVRVGYPIQCERYSRSGWVAYENLTICAMHMHIPQCHRAGPNNVAMHTE